MLVSFYLENLQLNTYTIKYVKFPKMKFYLYYIDGGIIINLSPKIGFFVKILDFNNLFMYDFEKKKEKFA